MFKETMRAKRRHHRARLIEREKRRINLIDSNSDLTLIATMRYNTMKSCSCHMCCNERSNPWIHGYERLTLQERKNLDDFKQQLEDYFNDD